MNAKYKSDIAISSQQIFFCDDNLIKSISIDSENTISILTKEPYYASYFSISQDGKRLAYNTYLDEMFHHSAIIVFDIETGKKQQVYNYDSDSGTVDSISWAYSGKSLLISIFGNILKIEIDRKQSDVITQGYEVNVLSKNMIGYWRVDGKDTAFYRKRLDSNSEEEVYRTKTPFAGIDWSPKGRFIIAAVPTYSGKFFNPWHHVTTPFIWDTKTKSQYRLPHCGYYSGCIFWKDSVSK